MPLSDKSSRAAVNRRRLIAGGAAASFGAIAAGGIYSSSIKPDHLARALLRDMVGPFRMSRFEFNNFLGRFQAQCALPEGLRRGVLTGLGQVGLLAPTLAAAPAGAVDGVVDLQSLRPLRCLSVGVRRRGSRPNDVAVQRKLI